MTPLRASENRTIIGAWILSQVAIPTWSSSSECGGAYVAGVVEIGNGFLDRLGQVNACTRRA